VLVVVGVGVLAVSMAALGARWRRAGLVGEWATYMVLAFAILSWRPFRAVLAGSGRVQRLAVVGCLFLLALGQFVGGGRHTFPFVRFAMFTDPAETEAHYYTYVGVARSGRTVPLDPVDLYPSLDRGRFDGRLELSLEAAREEGPGSDAARDYDQLLTAIVTRHNRDAADPLVRLEVYTVEADIDPPPRERTAVTTTRVWSLEAGR
jgi:hypothetical protein